MKTPIRFFFTLLCAAIASFLIVLALLPPAHAASSPPGNVAAQTVPTMTIVIYNNSKNHSIYPVLSTGRHDEKDTWLQAAFKIPKSQLADNPYPIRHAFRLYFNPKGAGIPPGGNVTITLPLYTQLVANANVNPKKPDQYIDWWAGGRVYIYESLSATGRPPNALVADYTMRASQTRVTPVGGAALPTCPKCQQPLAIFKDTAELPSNDPNQLIEYTLGAINLTKDPYQLNVKNVDYDVSYVDNAYLPAAMEPYNYPLVGYVGTIQEIDTFQGAVKRFLAGKFKGWPQYIDNGNQKILRIPSALHIMLDQAKLTPPPPWRPVEDMKMLWRNCTANGGLQTDVCAKIRNVRDLFEANYANYKANYRTSFKNTCDQRKQPAPPNLTEAAMLAHVYGWGPFNDNCKAETNLLENTPGYKENNSLKYQQRKTDFDALQYLPTGEFDPYVDLIHGKDYLNMEFVYAYSVDDAVGNMQTTGEGLIIAVGGQRGLPNPRPATAPIHVPFGFSTRDTVRFVKYGVCTNSPNQKVDADFPSFDLSTNQLDDCTLSFVDNLSNKYFFKIIKQPPYPGKPPKDKPIPEINKRMIGCSGNTPEITRTWCQNIFGYTENVISQHKKVNTVISVAAPAQPPR